MVSNEIGGPAANKAATYAHSIRVSAALGGLARLLASNLTQEAPIGLELGSIGHLTPSPSTSGQPIPNRMRRPDSAAGKDSFPALAGIRQPRPLLGAPAGSPESYV
jgi:hypothetical protein